MIESNSELLVSAFKVLIFCSLMVLLWYEAKAVETGRALARASLAEYDALLKYKKLCVSGILWTTVLSVVLIEVMVQVSGERFKFPKMFLFHIIFAVLFVLLFLAMRFRFNGDRYPDLHRKFVYPYLLCGIIALVSGGWMLVRV